MLAVKLLGAPSYVQLFLIPCLVLGVLLFRRGERSATALVFVAVLLAYLSLDGRMGEGMASLGPEDFGAIATINAISVACLTAVIGIVFFPLLGHGRRQRPQ